MASLNALRAEATEKLTIKISKLEAPDGTVDVGEEFRVVFRVTNEFSVSDDEDNFEATATYRDVKLEVKGTKFAEIVGGDRTIDVADRLAAGAVADVDVTLKAVGKFPQLVFAPEIDIREPYVEYELRGQLDVAEFFRVTRTGKASTQITDRR